MVRDNPMKTGLMIFLVCMLSGSCSPQSGPGKYQSYATAEGLCSAFGNPAGLAAVRTMTLGLYTCRPYLLKELEYKSLCLSIPVRTGALALSYMVYGYNLFKKEQAGLAFSRRFGRTFSAAVQLDYLSVRMPEPYGALNDLAYNAGFLCKMNKVLTFGGHFNKSTKINSPGNEEVYPSSICFGMACNISNQMCLHADISKEIYNKPDLGFGFTYQDEKTRIGLVFSPDPICAGFYVGIKTGNLVVVLLSAWDPRLGYSPGIDIEYSLRKQIIEQAQDHQKNGE
jgi:hypothetical protein